MAEAKTKATAESVEAFLGDVADEARRADCRTLVDLMREATGAEPRMWGGSIVGFGSYHYTYESGREGDWFIQGFSPRKGDLSLYVMPGFEAFDGVLDRLGKFKTGKACLYVKRLSDVDLDVLRELLACSVAAMASQRTD